MAERIRVATRGGKLAIAQTELVISALKKVSPDINPVINQIKTTGDKDRSTILWTLKGSGFFTSQLEKSLLADEADIAVHSFKDLPTTQPDGLCIAAVCLRNFPEDCLLCASPAKSIDELRAGSRVGTSSLRRKAQIRRLRTDLDVAPIRGNVRTRVRKVESGEYDAVVLARAGLERIGLEEKITTIFDPTDFLPAPAQGALAVQVRTKDRRIRQLVEKIDDHRIHLHCRAERHILISTGCGQAVGPYS